MFLGLIIGIFLQVIAALLVPKPKQPKNRYVTDIKAPTSEAGRPIPVPFGSITLKSPNCLYFGQVTHVERDSLTKKTGK